MILRLSLLVFIYALINSSQESALHGSCLSNDDCGTIDTFCKNQTCVCKENFAVWYDSCVQMPHPHLRCSKKQECHAKLGARSMCTKKGQCACKPFHHLHQGQCVKNRDLHDVCDHDHQCYCGADCEGKIACIHKICSCKPGHKTYKIRRCISDPVDDGVDESVVLTTIPKHKLENIDQNSEIFAKTTLLKEEQFNLTTEKVHEFSNEPSLESKSSSSSIRTCNRLLIIAIVIARSAGYL